MNNLSLRLTMVGKCGVTFSRSLFLGKGSIMKLGFLMNLGTVLLAITALAPSPIYGQTQPHYVAQSPNPPAAGQSGSSQPQRPPAAGQSRSTYRFNFTRSTEYTQCLEDILLLYQNRAQLQQQGRQGNCLPEVFQANLQQGVSKTQAQQMIQSAHFYATSLRPKLYPPRGQRERIAALLGFIYEVDKNDQSIRQLAIQGPSVLDAPPLDSPSNEVTQPDDGGW